jgi:hypothetical protein
MTSSCPQLLMHASSFIHKLMQFRSTQTCPRIASGFRNRTDALSIVYRPVTTTLSSCDSFWHSGNLHTLLTCVHEDFRRKETERKRKKREEREVEKTSQEDRKQENGRLWCAYWVSDYGSRCDRQMAQGSWKHRYSGSIRTKIITIVFNIGPFPSILFLAKENKP